MLGRHLVGVAMDVGSPFVFGMDVWSPFCFTGLAWMCVISNLRILGCVEVHGAASSPQYHVIHT